MIAKYLKNAQRNVVLKNDQRGFIVSYVLLGVLLLSVIVAVIAFANRGAPEVKATGEQIKLDAQVIIKNGNDIKNGVLRLSLSRDISEIDLNAWSNNGLFNPSLGVMNEVRAPVTARAQYPGGDGVSSGRYYLDFGPPGFYAVVLPDITESVCKSINNILNGTNSTMSVISIQDVNPEELPHGCLEQDGWYMYFNLIRGNSAGGGVRPS